MPTNNINHKVKEVVESFLDEYIYPEILDMHQLLGILVYGSSLTGNASKNSDIDLLILMNEGSVVTRGVTIHKGQKIEYFIKPIERFFDESIMFTNSNCPSHVALGQNAYILYDNGGIVKNFLEADKTFYNKNHKKPNVDFDKKLVQIENRLASLKNIADRYGKEFYYVYYNTLELIRQYNSGVNGEADIPFAKAYRIYTDPEYYDKFVGQDADNPKPTDEFVKRYISCIEVGSRKQMMQNIQGLYDYIKQFSKIDPTNYQIRY